MVPRIYPRVLGQAFALGMHGVNSAVMFSSLLDDVIMQDPEIQTLASMQSTFLTVWNIGFQMAYFSLALTSDVLTLTGRDHLLPKFVKKFRDFFFSSVVFPGTLLVFLVFWPFYLYDRSIIFPEYIDKVFSQKSNYVMHIGIVPVILWELAFQPRDRPKSHKPYLAVIVMYFMVYNLHIFNVYFQRGLWPYPLLGIVYGTIYNVILYAYIFLLMLAAYYVQWPISEYFIRKKIKNNKITKLRKD